MVISPLRAGISSTGTCISVPYGEDLDVDEEPVEMGVCKTVWTTDDASALRSGPVRLPQSGV